MATSLPGRLVVVRPVRRLPDVEPYDDFRPSRWCHGGIPQSSGRSEALPATPTLPGRGARARQFSIGRSERRAPLVATPRPSGRGQTGHREAPEAAAVVKGVTGKKALRCEGGIVRDVLRAICEVIGAFERSEGARYLKMGRFMAKDRFLQAICGGHIAVAVLVRYQLQSDASGDDPGLLEGWALAGEKAEAAWS